MKLFFDESGNFGSIGRYFTIACVGGNNIKPLQNVMRKSILKVKRKFPKYSSYREIKASDANPVIKDYILRKIASKDIDIRYIVADLKHIDERLIKDENLLYNYLLKFLILPIAKTISENGTNNNLSLFIDKRAIKVKSINSFADYIRIQIRYENNLDVNVHVEYFESQNSYCIQAADYIANAIYTKYEYGNSYYYDLFKHKVSHVERFPYRFFGID